jgi:hypothetical protein
MTDKNNSILLDDLKDIYKILSGPKAKEDESFFKYAIVSVLLKKKRISLLAKYTLFFNSNEFTGITQKDKVGKLQQYIAKHENVAEEYQSVTPPPSPDLQLLKEKNSQIAKGLISNAVNLGNEAYNKKALNVWWDSLSKNEQELINKQVNDDEKQYNELNSQTCYASYFDLFTLFLRLAQNDIYENIQKIVESGREPTPAEIKDIKNPKEYCNIILASGINEYSSTPAVDVPTIHPAAVAVVDQEENLSGDDDKDVELQLSDSESESDRTNVSTLNADDDSNVDSYSYDESEEEVSPVPASIPPRPLTDTHKLLKKFPKIITNAFESIVNNQSLKQIDRAKLINALVKIFDSKNTRKQDQIWTNRKFIETSPSVFNDLIAELTNTISLTAKDIADNFIIEKYINKNSKGRGART